MGKCSNCKQKSARPVILSRTSIIIALFFIDPSKRLLALGAVFIIIAIEFMAFKLEPISQEWIENRNNYLLLFLALIIILIFFFFKQVLTYSPSLW